MPNDFMSWTTGIWLVGMLASLGVSVYLMWLNILTKSTLANQLRENRDYLANRRHVHLIWKIKARNATQIIASLTILTPADKRILLEAVSALYAAASEVPDHSDLRELQDQALAVLQKPTS